MQAAMGQQERRASALSYRGQRPAAVTGRHTYTRPEIAELYKQHRKGAFSDAEWARQEADIIAAGREGCVIGTKDVAGR